MAAMLRGRVRSGPVGVMLDRGRVLAGLGHRPHPQPPTVDQRRQRVDQDPPNLQLSYRLPSLMGDCRPDSMLDGLDPKGSLQIAQLLRERLEAGWEPRQIRTALDQNLPAKVSRLSGLVASRLRSNVAPSLAPNKVKANAERRRREAAQRRSNAIAAPERPQHDPALETALTKVRQRMPSASWPEQVEAAWAIVNEASTDGPKETP